MADLTLVFKAADRVATN